MLENRETREQPRPAGFFSNNENPCLCLPARQARPRSGAAPRPPAAAPFPSVPAPSHPFPTLWAGSGAGGFPRCLPRGKLRVMGWAGGRGQEGSSGWSGRACRAGFALWPCRGWALCSAATFLFPSNRPPSRGAQLGPERGRRECPDPRAKRGARTEARSRG